MPCSRSSWGRPSSLAGNTSRNTRKKSSTWTSRRTMPEEAQESRPRVSPQPIEDELHRSYIDYAMSVIVGRALPDVRDGLKPVQRRILHAMNELGMSSGSAHKKAARVVGEGLGKWHPHGGLAVYDALARMVPDFSLR